MKHDDGDDWVVEPDGSVSVGAVRYRRTSERVKRRAGSDYVDHGALIVTDRYPEGPLLFRGSAARRAWTEMAGDVVSGPGSKAVHEYWSGHVFESEAGLVLLWMEGHH